MESNSLQAPYSCSACRRRHRRCDRNLPVCGPCVANNGVCLFEATCKRGPRGKNVAAFSYSPYQFMQQQQIEIKSAINQPQQQSTILHNFVPNESKMVVQHNIKETFLAQKYDDYEVTKIYFGIRKLSFFVPLIEESKVDKIINYVNNVHSGNLDTLNNFVPVNEDLALIYSMQAHMFKNCGYQAFAQYFFDKSRRLLNSCFDNVLYNQAIAATFTYLSAYLAEDGESDRAEFYLKNLHDYLEQQGPKRGEITMDFESIRDYFLEVLMHSTQGLLDKNEDLSFVIKNYITGFLTVKMYDKLRSAISDSIEQIPVGDELFPHLNMIKDDVAHLRNNFCLNLQFIDQLSNMITKLYDQIGMTTYKEEVPIQKLAFLLFANGFKMQLLQKMGLSTLSTSDFISAMTETPPFAFSPVHVAISVVLATQDHINNGDASIPQLKQDLRALCNLKNKFKLVGIRYASVIEQAEVAIRDYEYRQSILNSLPEGKSNQTSEIVDQYFSTFLSGAFDPSIFEFLQ